MMSETLTHWKKLHNPNYLGSFSFDPGQDKIVTVKSVGEETVTGEDGKKESCMVMRFAEPELPFIVNSTNAKTIQKLFKTPYIQQWQGRKIQLYVTQVKAFGEVVDAVRVRPYPPREECPVCSVCGAQIRPFGKMTAAQVAQYSAEKFGAVLCTSCGKKRAAGAEQTISVRGGDAE